ncbi:MAG: S-formylglutathione hydrolase [Sandaracinaceae bacterium]
METISTVKSFGGTQGVFRHDAATTSTPMTFGLFLPQEAAHRRVPLLLYLSGLTCTHANVTEKGGVQRAAAEHGMGFLAPDTSPRGLDLPGEHESWDFGSGAGFYVNATEPPWRSHYRMEDYVLGELLELIEREFPVDTRRVAVTGHSMGGHGALTFALKNPGRFRSVSALAPVCAPMDCPWGRKAFRSYLGPDESTWAAHDSCALIEAGRRVDDLLVDGGEADPFLHEQLKPERLESACKRASVPLQLRRQPGYDHSYYFVASFMDDHVRWAASRR